MRKDERRDRILLAALDLFSALGFNGTTVRELARRAGISEAILYRHFPSKEALYYALLERKVKKDGRPRMTSAGSENNEKLQIEAIIGDYIREQASDSSFMRLLLFSALESNELSQKLFDTAMQSQLSSLSSFLEQAKSAEIVKDWGGEVVARLIIGMAFSLVVFRDLFNDPRLRELDSEQITSAILDLICKGLDTTNICHGSSAARMLEAKPN